MTKSEFVSKIDDYIVFLKHNEKSENTIRKYRLGIMTFVNFADSKGWTESFKAGMIEYKVFLESKYKFSTANLYIIAINGFLKYIKESDLCLKTFKIQSQNILENCFTTDEYNRLLEVSKKQKNDVYYIIRTLANTGMRIRELPNVTVKTIKKGSFIVASKGKTRCIVIPKGICNELVEFCNGKGITDGYVFKGQKPGKPISQNSVRRWIKKVAELAGVDDKKAFPHNLRHLFAKTFLDKYGNLSELSDILGHTRLETTRIYTRTSIEEKRNKIENIGL